MNKKKKIIITSLATLLLLVCICIFSYHYILEGSMPDSWRLIKVGMTLKEAEKIAGEPDVKSSEKCSVTWFKYKGGRKRLYCVVSTNGADENAIIKTIHYHW